MVVRKGHAGLFQIPICATWDSAATDSRWGPRKQYKDMHACLIRGSVVWYCLQVCSVETVYTHAKCQLNAVR